MRKFPKGLYRNGGTGANGIVWSHKEKARFTEAGFLGQLPGPSVSSRQK
jgi:hypothetical protein